MVAIKSKKTYWEILDVHDEFPIKKEGIDWSFLIQDPFGMTLSRFLGKVSSYPL